MTVAPFRAGGEEFRIGPGDAQPQVVESKAFPAFTGTYTLLADISEFQPNLADAAYLAWSKAIVIRCAYGDAHDDRAWYGGARRDALHKGGVKFLGIYQYLIAGHSGAAQADAMARIVGAIRPGEVLIADFEEGTRPMLADWRARMLAHGYPAAQLWTYSGLAFEQAHGVTAEWVAAYRATEPSVPHRLWQFTSAFQVPGLPAPCDCSVFHGTVDQLAALAYHPAATPPPVSPARLPAPAGVSLTEHRALNGAWGLVDHPGGGVVSRYRAELAHGTPAAPGAVFWSELVNGTHLPPLLAIPEGPVIFHVKAAADGIDGDWSPWKAA